MRDREKKRLADKRYRQSHLQEKREKDRKYQSEHLDKHREASKRYYETHRKLCIQRNLAWQSRHHDKVLETDRRYKTNHPEEIRKRYIKYRRDHPELNAKYCTQRRSRFNSVICDLTREEILEMKSKGCLACDTKTTLTIAHNVPISKGGNTTRNNCFCLCKSCNSRMGTKTLEEWRPDLIEKYNLIYFDK
jgi:5-methylcytosine-specific restriction endonuclease McrA